MQKEMDSLADADNEMLKQEIAERIRDEEQRRA
jgi:hypothetical protein